DNSLRAAAEAERNRAIALAETAIQAKARFLSSMSHELHTPLHSILGFAQLIQTGTPPPSARQKHSLEQIEQAGWYLLELINQLLELAEIQSGQLTLNCEAVELAEVFKECQAMMEPQASRRSIATQFPVNSLAFRVQGDRTRVRQVLLNLLSNAVKYNREGGAIIVACEPLSATRLRITVADSGPGLNQEQLAQLFQPFNRLGREHSAEEGTGIGLVMTKYLVEMMDGEIGVISNPGQGCVFWVDLTLSQDIPGHLNIAQV
ncbi:MAG: HAMP domain-containing histidine kinase, partial [Moraxellaceae bacterium]